MESNWVDSLAEELEQTEATRAQNDTEVQPHQRPPEGDWDGWFLQAGRGAGKSYASMRWLDGQCQDQAGLRARVIAPTFADGVASCVDGPNGLLAMSNHRAKWNASAPGGSVLTYPNGSKVWIIGTPSTRDVDRLRALTNIEIDVFEEAFANVKIRAAWDQAALSRRRGRPRVVVTSTPRPHELIKEWEADPDFVITRARMRDNKYNDPKWVAKMEKTYAGTRLYRQEILGEVVDDVDGALWRLLDVERSAYDGNRGELIKDLRCAVGVDPPSGPGTCGIVVVGIDQFGHLYILDDYSVTDASPRQWALRAAQASADYHAPLVAEINQGGRMVTEVLKQASPGIPIHTVNAAKSKTARAQPISLLWEAEEQTGHTAAPTPETLAKLVDEMTGWVPDTGMPSPDHLDAMVWASTHLLKGTGKAEILFPKRNLGIKSGVNFGSVLQGRHRNRF